MVSSGETVLKQTLLIICTVSKKLKSLEELYCAKTDKTSFILVFCAFKETPFSLLLTLFWWFHLDIGVDHLKQDLKCHKYLINFDCFF